MNCDEKATTLFNLIKGNHISIFYIFLNLRTSSSSSKLKPSYSSHKHCKQKKSYLLYHTRVWQPVRYCNGYIYLLFYFIFPRNETVAPQLHVTHDLLSKQCEDYESTMKFGNTQRKTWTFFSLAWAAHQLSMSLFEGLDPDRPPTPDSS